MDVLLKSNNMKQIVLIFILAPVFAFGQIDSVVYKKEPNKSELYKADSIYYRYTFTKSGEVMTVRIEPFTDVDSLIRNTLLNNLLDASRQYKEAILAWEEAEKGYELRLRQAEKQYNDFFKESPKTEIEKGFDFTELIGDWLLNKEKVKIDAKLELNKQPIKILSDQQFRVQIDGEDVVFSRIKPGRWQSKGGKFVLVKDEDKEKKRKK